MPYFVTCCFTQCVALPHTTSYHSNHSGGYLDRGPTPYTIPVHQIMRDEVVVGDGLKLEFIDSILKEHHLPKQ